MNKELVFLVEDDEDYLELYQEVLGQDFDCMGFSNATDATTALGQFTPKAIVLDLNLPDENGLDLCRKLYEENNSNFEADIIFVSGETDPDVKLKAFDAGAADFITKPFELKELHYKVQCSVARKLKEASYKRDIVNSQKLVNTTMAQASQYSLVMNFFKNLSRTQTVEQLVEVFFNTMSNFSLICSIKVMLPKPMFFQVNGKEVSPIEKDVYQLLQPKGRVYHFSHRLILNDEHVSFIVKNPPKAEEELGQLRDYAAAIIEGLEAKLLEIYSQSGINHAINDLTLNIDKLKVGINEHNRIINSVMSNMMIEIASSYHSLEMTEIQESFLNTLVEKSTNELSLAERHLVNIMGGLENIRKNMLSVQKASQTSSEADFSDEIELF